MNVKKTLLTVASASFMMVMAACGSNGENENAEGNSSDVASAQGESLSGSVVIDGSGTVYPLMARIAEEFMLTEEEDVSVEVGRAGTSAGMQKFIASETDLSNASRPIKAEELKELESNNVETEELKVALDGLTLVINPDNSWATELTEDEIKSMFVTGNIKQDDNVLWSDIRDDWPEEKINFYGPNENHGTYEFFVDEIIDEQDLVEGINLQQEYSTLVNLIAEDVNGIAFFGYGYYASNEDKVKAVSVDFGNGPIAPSLETIAEDGPYANFTRPVFTNISINAVKEKPQVKAFAEYIFETGATEFAGKTGFAPLPEEELQETLELIQKIK